MIKHRFGMAAPVGNYYGVLLSVGLKVERCFPSCNTTVSGTGVDLCQVRIAMKSSHSHSFLFYLEMFRLPRRNDAKRRLIVCGLAVPWNVETSRCGFGACAQIYGCGASSLSEVEWDILSVAEDHRRRQSGKTGLDRDSKVSSHCDKPTEG